MNTKLEISLTACRGYMVVLTRRNGESEIESTHMVTGNENLTEAMVASVGLNFVTNGDCLHFSSDDDAFSDGESLFWINSIAEVEQSDIQTVAKYIAPVHYEILLQGGEAKEES